MKLFQSVAMMLAVFWWFTTSAASNCKNITNPTAVFWDSLGVTAETLHPAKEVLQNGDIVYPSISHCIASIDASTLLSDVLSHPSFGECLKLNNTGNGDELDAFCGKWGSAIPCLDKVVLPIITNRMDNAENNCCNNLKNNIRNNFGNDLKSIVSTLMRHTGNVICSQKTYTMGTTKATKTQRCIQALVSTLRNDTEQSMISMYQLPATSVCDAMQAKKFVLTKGQSCASFLPWRTRKKDCVFQSREGEERIGICYQPLYSLFSYLKTFPILNQVIQVNSTTSINLGDLFDANKCVPGANFAEAWLGRNGTIVKIVRKIRRALEQINDRSNSGSNSYRPSSDTSYWYNYNSSGSSDWYYDNAGSYMGSNNSDYSGNDSFGSYWSWSSNSSNMPKDEYDNPIYYSGSGSASWKGYGVSSEFFNWAWSHMLENITNACFHIGLNPACDFSPSTLKLAFDSPMNLPSTAVATTQSATSTTQLHMVALLFMILSLVSLTF